MEANGNNLNTCRQNGFNARNFCFTKGLIEEFCPFISFILSIFLRATPKNKPFAYDKRLFGKF